MNANALQQLRSYLNSQVIGQTELVNQLLVALLADGHILVEGPPGLAKTRAVKCLADCIEGDFHRVQFTPDLLPADLTGTDIFRPETGEFVFQTGPIFNSTCRRNQSSACQSSSCNVRSDGRKTNYGRPQYLLTPELFLVIATQNPLNRKNFPLPEAQQIDSLFT